MTTLFSDDFNRANSSTIGGNWTELVTGNWEIISNAIREPAGGSGSGAILINTSSLSTADYSVQADITQGSLVSGTQRGMGLIARYQDSNNFYLAWLEGPTPSPATAFRLYRVSGGTFTELGTAYQPGSAFSDPLTMRFEVQGTALRLFLNGTSRVTATDSTHSAAGNIGCRAFNGSTFTDHRFDNIVVADFATGTTYNLSGTDTQPQSLSLRNAEALTRSMTQATSARPLIRQFNLTRTVTKAQAATVQATRVFLRTVSATQPQALSLLRQFQLPRTVSQPTSLTISLRQSLLRTVAAVQSTALSVRQAVSRTMTTTVSEVLSGFAEFSSGEIRIFGQVTQPQVVSLLRRVSLLRAISVSQSATLTYHVPTEYALSGTAHVSTRASYSFIRCIARTYAQLEAMSPYLALEEFTYGDLEHECLGAPAAKRFVICPRTLRYAVPARTVRFTVEVR